jgi:hypothetical protein
VAPDTVATSVPTPRALSTAGDGRGQVNIAEIVDNFAAITINGSLEFKKMMNVWRYFSEDSDDDSRVGPSAPERHRRSFWWSFDGSLPNEPTQRPSI